MLAAAEKNSLSVPTKLSSVGLKNVNCWNSRSPEVDKDVGLFRNGEDWSLQADRSGSNSSLTND